MGSFFTAHAGQPGARRASHVILRPRMSAKSSARTALILLTALNFFNYIDRNSAVRGAGVGERRIQSQRHPDRIPDISVLLLLHDCRAADRAARRPLSAQMDHGRRRACLERRHAAERRHPQLSRVAAAPRPSSASAKPPSSPSRPHSWPTCSPKNPRPRDGRFLPGDAGGHAPWATWSADTWAIATAGVLRSWFRRCRDCCWPSACSRCANRCAAPAITWPIACERSSFLGLFRNKAYWTITLGAAMMTFAIGGLQVWMPTFLTRIRHVPLDTRQSGLRRHDRSCRNRRHAVGRMAGRPSAAAHCLPPIN